MQPLAIELCERGLVPDRLARAGMRRLIGQRLRAESAADAATRRERMRRFLQHASSGPVAEHTAAANRQHYEVPAAFFEAVLGPRLKYSACLFDYGVADLAGAEDAMLALTAQRAGLADGQHILDLGCGWGSLALWAAGHFPHARIVAISNSGGQKAHIDARATAAGLTNLEVLTRDINDFDLKRESRGPFDRIVSVEMFEHMRNLEELLRRVAGWLTPSGQALVHIFCHRRFAYPFADEGGSDWMARHFFTGGMMPSEDLLRHFDRDMQVSRQWWLDGSHYQATAEAWLASLDARRGQLRALFAQGYGADQADRWLQRWRMFFMAVAELFGYRGGQEWGVGHYLLTPRNTQENGCDH
ncbi:MAG: cyclopropane-fatty-acyl-phospholipid synthase family protein [Salinisphaera sp.]|nr:cyclopropane-fatty-acyl-phospholipid synthase family protein [Salinisphaera sp.]